MRYPENTGTSFIRNQRNSIGWEAQGLKWQCLIRIFRKDKLFGHAYFRSGNGATICGQGRRAGGRHEMDRSLGRGSQYGHSCSASATGGLRNVAMASIVVGLIDTLFNLGVGSALVQNKHAGREEFDTAWTLHRLQAVFAALLVWLVAPLAAEYFRDPRVIDVIRVMALAILSADLKISASSPSKKTWNLVEISSFSFSAASLGLSLPSPWRSP